jgi:hypothetical protein
LKQQIEQQIIQNSLWIGLSDQIFRSLFRLLAAEQEGKELDKEWIGIYDSGKPKACSICL